MTASTGATYLRSVEGSPFSSSPFGEKAERRRRIAKRTRVVTTDGGR